MKKTELIEKIAKDSGISEGQAEKVLRSFTGSVTASLKKGEPVTLIGFGRFSVAQRSARNGYNPQSGATNKIQSKNLARFKPGKTLSGAIEKGRLSE